MNIATRRSDVTTNGPCIVGSSVSGPSPTASTEPKRDPQSLPQLGKTLQGDGNMPTRGKNALLQLECLYPSPGAWSISISSIRRSKSGGLSFSPFCN
jgi:hypothetical protein